MQALREKLVGLRTRLARDVESGAKSVGDGCRFVGDVVVLA
jgi:hypothetical protein